MSDPLYDKTVLIQASYGPNLTKGFLDASPKGRAPASVGEARNSDEQAKYQRWSIKFADYGGWIEYAWSDDFNLGGVGAAEVFFYFTTLQTCVILYCGQYGTNEPWSIIYEHGSKQLRSTATGFYSNVVTLETGRWYHVALTSTGANSWFFLDGQIVGSKTGSCFPGAASRLWIGGTNWTGTGFGGYLQGVRVTKGDPRYTQPFTPPSEAYWPDYTGPEQLPVRRIAAAVRPVLLSPVSGPLRSTPLPARLTDVVICPANAAAPRPLTRTMATRAMRRDHYFSGTGRISATVKKRVDRVDVPVRRHVYLFDEATHILVRDTWSDAATGAYTFDQIDPTRHWLVLADDWRQEYRAVAADRLTAEPPP